MCKKLICFVCFVFVLSLAGSASADLVALWRFNDDPNDTVGNLD